MSRQILKIERQIPLAPFNTFHVGGAAKFFARVDAPRKFLQAMRWAKQRRIPFLVLGGGSNILFPDEGYEGLVIKNEYRTLRLSPPYLEVGSGCLLRLAVWATVERGLAGLERLAGIPGTVGGAIRGNAGSFGMEISHALETVTVARAGREKIKLDEIKAAELEWDYRHSSFKNHPCWAIIRARFKLRRALSARLKKAVVEDMQWRRAKQPLDAPSAGSIFKNPSPEFPAGKLIEQAGLKGYCIGGAEVSRKHANFILAHEQATAQDIRRLIALVKREVWRVHKIKLEEEIVVVSPPSSRGTSNRHQQSGAI
jgi:UDP-N-acetylmuramate dehydrogenase